LVIWEEGVDRKNRKWRGLAFGKVFLRELMSFEVADHQQEKREVL
jgi:hypothetical protein